MIPLIILSKAQSLITGSNFSYIIFKYMMNIYYYIAFFISYPLSARVMISAREPVGARDDIGTRADKGYDMKNDMLLHAYHIPQRRK